MCTFIHLFQMWSYKSAFIAHKNAWNICVVIVENGWIIYMRFYILFMLGCCDIVMFHTFYQVSHFVILKATRTNIRFHPAVHKLNTRPTDKKKKRRWVVPLLVKKMTASHSSKTWNWTQSQRWGFAWERLPVLLSQSASFADNVTSKAIAVKLAPLPPPTNAWLATG